MKNDESMTDDGSASNTVGRFLVAACVLAVTISALLAGGGVRDFRPLAISVSPRIENGPAIGEALRGLLAIETGRSVRLVEWGGAGHSDSGVFLMLRSGFQESTEKEGELSLVGSIVTTGGHAGTSMDAPVIVSRPGDAGYLEKVVDRAGALVRAPGGDERVLAAVERLEAVGVRGLTGPKSR